MCHGQLGGLPTSVPKLVPQGVTLPVTGGKMPCMAARYDMRRDDEGYTVFDVWTGWPALVKGAEQADNFGDMLSILNSGRFGGLSPSTQSSHLSRRLSSPLRQESPGR